MPKNDSASTWGIEELESQWVAHLESMIADGQTEFNLRRLRFQAEQAPGFQEIWNGWTDLGEEERPEAWGKLITCSVDGAGELLPTCVQCGHCCLHKAPTLHEDDIPLVRGENLPWDKLVALRIGEPAIAPDSNEPFFLPMERIKIKDRSNTKTCTFFDTESYQCGIYHDRPIQCRAQACWDDTNSKELEQEAHLTRKELFAKVPPLLEIMAEHDQKCSFAGLREAFETLQKNKGENIDEVINILAYDDHIRRFTMENLKIPESALELVFGRRLKDRVRLFGFKVDVAEDGTHTLTPE